MKIKEMEMKTGISAKNIRFYEKQGLLLPGREKGNHYREYTLEDENRLLQIKLFRKIGVPVANIRFLLEGELQLKDCLELREQELSEEKERIEDMQNMCRMLFKTVQKTDGSLETLDASEYLKEIERKEALGSRFIDILNDFLTWGRNICVSPAFFFEPAEPVTNKEEFVSEIVKYSIREGLDVEIMHEGMEPIAYVDGKKYLFMLEQPRMVELPGVFRIIFPFFFVRSYGFKFIYAYAFQ